jgi:2-hydroxychromene-2-carboxylate isomerase
MNIKRRIARFLTSTLLTKIKYGIADAKRVIGRAPHEVHYFHQVDDPYSHLMAQVLHAFENAYNVKLIVHLVNPPTDDIAPDRQDLIDYSRRDAEKISPYHNLSFTDPGAQPSDEALHMARRALAGSSKRSKAAAKIGEAYWKNNIQALRNMSLVSPKETEAIFANGTKKRDSLGHYLGAMVYYGGEWYWGVDRLPYLEERLTNARLRHANYRQVTHFQTRPGFMTKPAKGRLTVEYFPSARSPYSYVSIEETLDLPNHYPVDLVVRPVLPMVMRGLPVPQRKGRYIVRDTKREAERIGVPFGNIFDPVGKPVERLYSLFPKANAQGKGLDLFAAFCQMAWAEGRDVGSDDGLRAVVARAGLEWEDMQDVLDTEDWRAEMEKNRLDLVDLGLWGVPSYRLLNDKGEVIFSCWGRDRVWLLACEIQKALT